MKRVFDIAIALIALLFLMPILILIAIAIKIDTPGPSIFTQVRVGLGGKPFYIYKFRSMVLNAHMLGSYYTSSNDRRITRIGAFIRKSSIDELPQLFNVLVGDMSIVGPRPNVFEQKADYSDDEWSIRNSVRPGITGLAQATLRSDATHEQRVNLELSYVGRRRSLLLDFKIIFMTIKQVVARGGN